jgi:hypothetical protein
MPPKNGGQAAGYSHLTDKTTGETTSHPTKQPEDGCQVFGYSHSTRLSKALHSHLTMLANYAN